jgi:predicted small lipoprotein YifL
MTTPTFRKASLLAIAVSAALAACGGGGGGDSTPAATTAPPATGTTTTATTTTGQTLTASTGTSSGAASNVTGNLQAGLPAIVDVPAANRVVTSVNPSTYTGEAIPLFNSINEWRGLARFEEENGGTALGVGLLTQTGALDTLAATLRTSQPNLVLPPASPADRATAIAAAQAQMIAAGYTTAYVLPSPTNSPPLVVSPGNFCAKSLFSTLPGVELMTSGVRDVGMSIVDDASYCLVLAGIRGDATWQLPPTGSSSVYPFPGKQLTLPNYFGDFAALGFTTQPGHAILASVASNEALPVAVTGVGTGAAVPTSQITINEFTLRVRGSTTTVPVRVFSQAGVVAGSGVTLNSTTQLLFPTSIMMVPEAPLQGATVYSATFRATVRGRTVTRTWEFTTA